MNMNRFLIGFLLILLLMACSEKDESNKEQASQPDHVWKTQVKAIEKAKEVENVIQKSDLRQRQAIDEMGYDNANE